MSLPDFPGLVNGLSGGGACPTTSEWGGGIDSMTPVPEPLTVATRWLQQGSSRDEDEVVSCTPATLPC
jgi:hypothetical protein